ncbi:MAG TPA: PIN domain-containing protein [Solirubrobacteraceae bacterium]|nr:PIN domain-containing protein [Solirubrobacteraceae bacterium]
MRYGTGVALVVDTSAWARQRHPKVAAHFRDTAQADLLVGCPVVALELLTTAKDEVEHGLLAKRLSSLRQAPITQGVCAAALTASGELASANQPRVPVADYLIAAAAAERGFGVLHYDHHYDTLADALGFESVWIVPPGTI